MSVTISEVGPGTSATAEWHIRNLPDNFDLLKDTACCPLVIQEGNGIPPVYLRFFFKSAIYQNPPKAFYGPPPIGYPLSNVNQECVSLNVEVVSNKTVPFLLQLHIPPSSAGENIAKRNRGVRQPIEELAIEHWQDIKCNHGITQTSSVITLSNRFIQKQAVSRSTYSYPGEENLYDELKITIHATVRNVNTTKTVKTLDGLTRVCNE